VKYEDHRNRVALRIKPHKTHAMEATVTGIGVRRGISSFMAPKKRTFCVELLIGLSSVEKHNKAMNA